MHRMIHGLIRLALPTAVAVLMMGFILLGGGCNTIEGVGKDVSAAGQTVADWASRDDK